MTLPALTTPISRADMQALEAAVAALERTSFARRMSQLAGRQLSLAGRAMPEKWRQASAVAARRALEAALRVAIGSLKNGGPRVPHRKLAGICGAVGGAVGGAALALELPVSTTLMLRAIADIAREEGEDLSDPAVSFACLEVFALGGHGEDERVFEGGYLALRGVLAKSVSNAATYVAAGGAAAESAPVVARFIAKDFIALRRRRDAEGRGAGGADPRRVRRRRRQHRLHGAFRDARARPFHCAASRARLWRIRSAQRICAHRARGGILGEGERVRRSYRSWRICST